MSQAPTYFSSTPPGASMGRTFLARLMFGVLFICALIAGLFIFLAVVALALIVTPIAFVRNRLFGAGGRSATRTPEDFARSDMPGWTSDDSESGRQNVRVRPPSEG